MDWELPPCHPLDKSKLQKSHGKLQGLKLLYHLIIYMDHLDLKQNIFFNEKNNIQIITNCVRILFYLQII